MIYPNADKIIAEIAFSAFKEMWRTLLREPVVSRTRIDYVGTFDAFAVLTSAVVLMNSPMSHRIDDGIETGIINIGTMIYVVPERARREIYVGALHRGVIYPDIRFKWRP